MDKVRAYLLHSYLYYILYQSIISDGEFDKLCQELLEEYDTLDHKYKHLFTKEELKAGTGFHISEEMYPDDIRQEALSLAVEY